MDRFDDIQTDLKSLKNRKKLKYIVIDHLTLAESFKTMNQLSPTVTLFDGFSESIKDSGT